MSEKVVFASNLNFNQAGSHAIVIGGSMAGMLAARVLREQFDHVTVIERDRFPDGPTARPGLPQARHVHALLTRGRLILEELFPGISDELKAAGARFCDIGADLMWLTPAGWGVRYNSGKEFLSFTRDLLDWTLRRRMKALDNVLFIEGCDVTGLIMDESRTSVTGVCVRRRNSETAETTLQADLVVDASGRGSKAPQWLTALGYPASEELTINAHFGYASRLYRIPMDWQADWQATYSQAAPPNQPRLGLVFPVENNCWMVTLGGGGGDYPSTDEAEFLAFARSLPNPMIYEAIKNAEPVTPIHANHSTINRLRYYERLARRPECFVVMGDGVCAFNPVYGQGMSIAAMEAMELKRCVLTTRRRNANGDLTGLASAFQKQLAKIVQHPWMLATGEDYRYPNTEGGETGARVKFMHWYIDQVMYLTTRSVAVRSKFLDIQNLLIPPSELFSPGIVLRVLGAVLPKAFQREEKAESRDYRFQPLRS